MTTGREEPPAPATLANQVLRDLFSGSNAPQHMDGVVPPLVVWRCLLWGSSMAEIRRTGGCNADRADLLHPPPRPSAYPDQHRQDFASALDLLVGLPDPHRRRGLRHPFVAVLTDCRLGRGGGRVFVRGERAVGSNAP